MVFRQVDDELTEEIEIQFCCNFLVDPLVDVVVLIGWLAFAFLEMLVKLAAVLEQEVEYFAKGIVYFGNIQVATRHDFVVEGLGTYKHAF